MRRRGLLPAALAAVVAGCSDEQRLEFVVRVRKL
jgi:hypothetical protein